MQVGKKSLSLAFLILSTMLVLTKLGWASPIVLAPNPPLIYNGKSLRLVFDPETEFLWLQNLGLFLSHTYEEVLDTISELPPPSEFNVPGYDFSNYGPWTLARLEEARTIRDDLIEDWALFPYTYDKLRGFTYYVYWKGRVSETSDAFGEAPAHILYTISSYSNVGGHIYGGDQVNAILDERGDSTVSAWVIAKKKESPTPSVVPEPGTGLTLLIGTLGVFLVRKKR